MRAIVAILVALVMAWATPAAAEGRDGSSVTMLPGPCVSPESVDAANLTAGTEATIEDMRAATIRLPNGDSFPGCWIGIRVGGAFFILVGGSDGNASAIPPMAFKRLTES
jgi:hypothetical protein